MFGGNICSMVPCEIKDEIKDKFKVRGK